MDPATEVGPVVAERQRSRIEGYLDSGREEGATVALGGGRPSGSDFAKGWYVEPTVFSDVDNKMKIAQEEIFGPVLVVIPYDGDDKAVDIANDSNYGLCGSVWTGDNDRGLGVARQVRTGTYMLNAPVPIDFSTPVRRLQGVGRRAASSAPRDWRPSWRRSRSPCRPATPRGLGLGAEATATHGAAGPVMSDRRAPDVERRTGAGGGRPAAAHGRSATGPCGSSGSPCSSTGWTSTSSGAAATRSRRAFGVGDTAIGVLFSAFILVNGIVTLPAGYLADRWNRTRAMAVTIVPWSVISALGGLVPDRLPSACWW